MHSPTLPKQLISPKSGRWILKTAARKSHGYHVQCPVPASVEEADQSWRVDTDQNGKDQVWGDLVHEDELTENNLYKFQLVQAVLKIIKLTKI